MSTIKALFPGAAITLLISALLCGAGSRGGVFALERTELLDFNLYWSWPLFLVTFGLARALCGCWRAEFQRSGQRPDRGLCKALADRFEPGERGSIAHVERQHQRAGHAGSECGEFVLRARRQRQAGGAGRL